MEPIVNVSGKCALIVDGMAFVQQAQVSDKTFGQLAMDLLERILKAEMKASRIDVVFDEYRNKSIKNIERSRRPRGELVFKRSLHLLKSNSGDHFYHLTKIKTPL